jgi:hypothetical protein
MDHEHPAADADAGEGPALEPEIVDGVVVVASVRALEPVREAQLPFVQVAAVAATGFMAGAATAAVLGRRMSRVQARRAGTEPVAPSRRGPFEVVGSQRFLVDVYTLARRQ